MVERLSTKAGHQTYQAGGIETIHALDWIKHSIGEAGLCHWIAARGEAPTLDEREGFRLLALHRQGGKGEPSFNACREACRELVYHHNLIAMEPDHPEVRKRLAMAAPVATHLHLFIGGKMEVAQLGEFCCSSRPLRAPSGDRPEASAGAE